MINMRHFNLLIIFALVGLPLHAALPFPAKPPVYRGPIHAFGWHATVPDCSYVHSLVWMSRATDPLQAAEISKKFPADVPVTLFLWADLCMIEPDTCQTADGKEVTYKDKDGKDQTYCFPSYETNTPLVRARILDMLTKYKAAGGRADYLITDIETTMNIWWLKDDNLLAIQNDPRFPALREELGFADMVKDRWQEKNHYAMNGVLARREGQALNIAAFAPARQLFPAIVCAQYEGGYRSKDNAGLDLNGWPTYWPLPEPYLCGDANAQALYGCIGTLKERTLAGNKPYGDAPFSVLRWEINNARANMRSSDVPNTFWIGTHGIDGSGGADSSIRYNSYNDYHPELIYHLAMSNSLCFLWFQPKETRAWANREWNNSNDDDRMLDWLLQNFNKRVGNFTRQCVTKAAIAWDSSIIATGCQLGDEKVLWRVTAAPGIRFVRVKPTGDIIDLHQQVGAWYESKPGQALSFEDYQPPKILCY